MPNEAPPQAPFPLLALRSGGDLLDAKPGPQPYALAPWFPQGEFTVLVGAHATFKSTIALAACFSVTTGLPWLDCVPVATAGRAVFITLEDSVRTLHTRAKSWLHGVPGLPGVPGDGPALAEKAIRDRFQWLSGDQARSLVLTETKGARAVARLDVAARLAGLCDGASLVVVETSARLHGGMETNEHLAVFAQQLERIAQQSGAALTLVHHVPKAAAREGTTDSYAGRGGGSLSDAARSVITIVRAKDDDPLAAIRVTHAKCTTARPAEPMDVIPHETPHGVLVRTVAPEARMNADAERLLGHLTEAGAGGSTATELRDHPPRGLSRSRARVALGVLVRSGRAVESSETRGRTRQPAMVYRAATFAAPPVNALELFPPAASPAQQGTTA